MDWIVPVSSPERAAGALRQATAMRAYDALYTHGFVLLRGAFERRDRLPEPYEHAGTSRRLSVLAEVAAELSASPSQVVLAWLIGRTPSITPIVGVSSAAQLEAALAGARLVLSADQQQRLDAAG